MNNSNIEWTDMTWNPFVGCSKISPGCQNCYAEKFAWRLANNPKLPAETRAKYQRVVRDGKWTGEIAFFPERLEQPLKMRKPKQIFVGSMGDLFHKMVLDDSSVWPKLFDIARHCQQHIFLFLTKRPENMKSALCSQKVYDAWGAPWHCEENGTPLPNVWLGVTVENQEQADKRIPELLRIPAAKRFVSIEPMLGAVDLTRIKWAEINVDPSAYARLGVPAPDRLWSLNNVLISRPADKLNPAKIGLDLVIVGGETGPGARPVHPDWVRKVRDDCMAAGVPFYFKQWGEYHPVVGEIADKWVHLNGQTFTPVEGEKFFPAETAYPIKRVGRVKAGHLLDGIEYRGWPE